jgi:hypothetical protein
MPGIKLPVSFGEFVKNKKDAITYMSIVAMVALFGLLYKGWLNEKKDLNKRLVDCDTNIYTSRVETKQLRDQYIEVMGALKEIQGEVNTLKKLGIIK